MNIWYNWAFVQPTPTTQPVHLETTKITNLKTFSRWTQFLRLNKYCPPFSRVLDHEPLAAEATAQPEAQPKAQPVQDEEVELVSSL